MKKDRGFDVSNILGRAGTGKSTQVLAEIKDKNESTTDRASIIIITPMQGTYLYEQVFVKDTELLGSVRTEVLHFERLGHRIFQEVGGVHENVCRRLPSK